MRLCESVKSVMTMRRGRRLLFPAEASNGRERVEASDGELCRRLDRETFWKDEEAVEKVERANRACGEERNSRIRLSEQAAYGGAEHEGNSEDGADLAERGDALVRRRDVGDVGLSHHNVGAHHAADQSREQNEGQRLADGGHDHHDRETKDAREQHWSPPDAI